MKTRSLLLALPLLALAAGGCKDDMTSVQLAAICLPPDDASNCAFGDTCDMQSIGIAMMDTSLSDWLWLTVQVNNQTTNNRDETNYRANSHDAYIEEVSTEYLAPFPVGETSHRVGPYLVPAGGSAVVSLFAIAPTASFDIRMAVSTEPVGIVAKMKAKGHFQDQTEFETAAMEVAVDVCDGCFDPTPCVTGTVVAVCPPNRDGLLGVTQVPQSFKCE